MKWHTDKPPKTAFCNDLFFVRIEEVELGCKRIKFDTNVWYGSRWSRLRHEASGDRITHWAYIDDPVLLEGNNFYDDDLGRMECVVQAEVLPDLSTPPGKDK